MGNSVPYVVWVLEMRYFRKGSRWRPVAEIAHGTRRAIRENAALWNAAIREYGGHCEYRAAPYRRVGR